MQKCAAGLEASCHIAPQGNTNQLLNKESNRMGKKLPKRFMNVQIVGDNSLILLIMFWTVITKYYKLSGVSNRNLFFIVLEVGKSRIKVPADWVS